LSHHHHQQQMAMTDGKWVVAADTHGGVQVLAPHDATATTAIAPWALNHCGWVGASASAINGSLSV
jgi:hypothetical protein